MLTLLKDEANENWFPIFHSKMTRIIEFKGNSETKTKNRSNGSAVVGFK